MIMDFLNMNDRSFSQKKQAGMTLIEIMIALLLGLFLIAGLLQIFTSTKQSYRLAEAQSRLQENSRFALEMINHDIRLAGFIGCSGIRVGGATENPTVIANDPLIAPVAHAGIPAVVAAYSITGGNDNAAGSFTSPSPALSISPATVPPNTLTNAIIGTDAITVQFAESCGGFVTAPIATTNIDWVAPGDNISTTNACGINLGTGTNFANLGTPLVISDCSTAHIFRADDLAVDQNKDGVGGATATLINKPAPGYAAGSEVLLFRSYTYYIRLGAGGQPSLWRLNNNFPVTANSNPEEMIEGVENMQILYGIETDTAADAPNLVDNSANRYVTANNIPNLDPTLDDWRRVVSIRIILTVRSLEDNLMDTNNVARTYNSAVAGNLVDRRLIKTFTSTIELRNR
jgi:type IV pilus assembly protein PilW